MDRQTTVVAVVIALGAAGCDGDGGGGPDHPGLTVQIDTVDGHPRVMSLGEAPRWRLDTLLTLGTLGGTGGAPAPDEFGSVASVALGPDGLLYVADRERDRIQVFDTTGAWVRALGREGEGPGEFRELYSLAFLGDTLLALDLTNRRLSFLTTEGRELATRPALSRLVRSPVRNRLYPVGPREVVEFAWSTAGGEPEEVWRTHGPGGAATETPREGYPLPTDEILNPTRREPDQVVCSVGGGATWFPHPYAGRYVAHPAPGGAVWAGRSSEYRLLLLGPGGDTLRVVERDVPRAPLTDAVWDTTAARFDAWMADSVFGRPRRQLRCSPPDLTRPPRQAAYHGILVDTRGRLWVERITETGALWEIFDRSGALQAALPSFHHDRVWGVPWIGPDHIAWHTRDALGLSHVHLARIVR